MKLRVKATASVFCGNAVFGRMSSVECQTFSVSAHFTRLSLQGLQVSVAEWLARLTAV